MADNHPYIFLYDRHENGRPKAGGALLDAEVASELLKAKRTVETLVSILSR